MTKLTRILSAAMLALVSVFLLAGCTATDTTTTTSGGMSMIIMMLVVIVVFYFFMIRPENKRKKKQQEMRDSIAVGDKITTIGGMMGRVVSVGGDHLTFETGEDRVRIQVTKWAVSSVGKDSDEPQ